MKSKQNLKKALHVAGTLALTLAIGAVSIMSYAERNILDAVSALSLNSLIESAVQLDGTGFVAPEEQGSFSSVQSLTPEDIRITYPVVGETYPIVKGVVGEVTAANDEVKDILVRIYDVQLARYYDGTSFNAIDPVEHAAFGQYEWILPLELYLNPDHDYVLAARAEKIDGTFVEAAEKVGFKSAIDVFDSSEADALLRSAPTAGEPAVFSETVDADNGPEVTVETEVVYGEPVVTEQTGTSSSTTVSRGDLRSGLETLTTNVTSRDIPETYTFTTTTTNQYETTQFVCEGEGGVGALPTEVNKFFLEVCSSPNIMEVALGIPSEEAYLAKFDEYTDRQLIEQPVGIYNTIGIRDSDNDGLADRLEITYKTDPFYRDTDRDGYDDGAEVIVYGTDPNDANDTPGRALIITNIADEMRTKDVRPLIVGSGAPSALVRIYEVDDANERSTLIGSGRTDAQGKFMIEPLSDLAAGEHLIAAFEENANGGIITRSQNVLFFVDPTLDIPPPIVERIDVEAMRPHVFGKTIFGATVVAHFDTVLNNAAAVADTENGDFVVASNEPMQVGTHTVTLYATLPNGVRSEKVIVPFTIGLDGSGGILDLGWLALLLAAAGSALAGWLIWALMHAKDMVLFSVEKSDLLAIEAAKKAGHYTYTSKLPLNTKDLKAKRIGFYMNGWGEQTGQLADFAQAKEGYVSAFGDVEEIMVEPADGSKAVNVLAGEPVPENLDGARVTYRFNKYEKDVVPYREFAGKKNIPTKELYDKEELQALREKAKQAEAALGQEQSTTPPKQSS